MSTLQIKGHDGSVVIEVSQYERPDATDRSDANWLSSTIEVKVGSFSGRYAATLTTHDFAAFGTELEALLAREKSIAVFVTDEGWLSLEITIDSRGSGKVIGEACDQGPRAKLSFAFETDQTYLAEARRAVADLVRTFPVKT
jgi:hypothetical protein